MRLNPLMERLKRRIRSLFHRPEDPEDPYAFAGARVPPKLPTLRARAAAEPDN